MGRKVLKDEATFRALMKAGAEVRSTPYENTLRAEHVLGALDHASDWRTKFRSFWLPKGFYYVEVE